MGKGALKKKNFFLLVITAILFIAFSILLFFVQLDAHILPSALALSCAKAKTTANEIINAAIEEVINEGEIKSSDFYSVENKAGTVTADSMAINGFCLSVSQGIQKRLSDVSEEKISVAIGSLSGIQSLANRGPKVNFYILPAGEAKVDYETSFSSAGINQVNFKIWINVEVSIKIANPLISENVILARKLMLLDTVIQGDVPGTYLNMPGSGSN